MIRPQPGSRAGSRMPRVPSDEQLAKTGASMRRIRSSRANVDWLQGPGPTDLWIWHNVPGPNPTLVELTFFGRSVSLRGETLSTGRCEQGSGSPYAQETDLLELDATLDPITLAAAEKLLLAFPADVLSPEVRALTASVQRARTVSVAPTPAPEEPNR